jgi:hypothetical protein
MPLSGGGFCCGESGSGSVEGSGQAAAPANASEADQALSGIPSASREARRSHSLRERFSPLSTCPAEHTSRARWRDRTGFSSSYAPSLPETRNQRKSDFPMNSKTTLSPPARQAAFGVLLGPFGSWSELFGSCGRQKENRAGIRQILHGFKRLRLHSANYLHLYIDEIHRSTSCGERSKTTIVTPR